MNIFINFLARIHNNFLIFIMYQEDLLVNCLEKKLKFSLSDKNLLKIKLAISKLFLDIFLLKSSQSIATEISKTFKYKYKIFENIYPQNSRMSLIKPRGKNETNNKNSKHV